MIENKRLQEGFRSARAITKRHAHTFYCASHFLPRRIQQAACAIYAVCRIIDDSVDIEANTQHLEALREKIGRAYRQEMVNDDLLYAFGATVATYEIPKHYFDKLIEGMYMDLGKNRYENFDQLYAYCYRVAGVVGLIMLKIFGVTNVKAQKSAVELGIAMQLTNIIRDVKEDGKRSRIYLPSDEMARHGVSENHIQNGINDNRWKELLKFNIMRARTYYSGSIEGLAMIENKRTRFVVAAMKEMYARILTTVEKNDYDVFSSRCVVSFFEKLKIILKLFFRGIKP